MELCSYNSFSLLNVKSPELGGGAPKKREQHRLLVKKKKILQCRNVDNVLFWHYLNKKDILMKCNDTTVSY